MDWLVHQHNLETKITTDYKKRGQDFAEFKTNVYLPYQKKQLGITEITRQAVFDEVQLLEGYYREIEEFNQEGWITPQSKFRPTVLEEFCGYLFKDLPQVQSLGLGFLKRGIYAGMRIDQAGNAQLETRDIDFCIGKIIKATFADEPCDIKIPVVAIECKTYLDKTMLSGAQFTAQKVKGGTPRVAFFVMAERNEVNLGEIPSETPIDQIYILRDGQDNPVDSQTVWEFFCEVRGVLERTSKAKIISLPGKLLVF
ncbi:MAG: Bpu10I family restriction endonuclease [Chloroflexota bacterium]|nr:Bpu10I family restriction endonuclease [Chloroflexota bacterium]